MYELRAESSFDSAHFLTNYYGKCENLHGHRWRIVAYLAVDSLGSEGTERDMVVDFGSFKETLRSLTNHFDHMFLVEEGSLAQQTISALEAEGFSLLFLPFRTTAENLARYFYEELAAKGLPISRVDCYETPNNRASYIGEQAGLSDASSVSCDRLC